jgi:hypothetical protein
MGRLVFDRRTATCGETIVMAYVAGGLSIHSVVVIGAGRALMLHFLEEGRPVPPNVAVFCTGKI